jgi:hypothetical protein
MKNSLIEPPCSQPSPNGCSAVTQQVLSRRPTLFSGVEPTLRSAVTHPALSRGLTAEHPSKYRLSALIFQQRLNLSAQILQVDFEHRHAACSAPPARERAERVVSVKDEEKTSKA